MYLPSIPDLAVFFTGMIAADRFPEGILREVMAEDDRCDPNVEQWRWKEKINADINERYAELVTDVTKEKFAVWHERLGPVVRDIIASNKDDPDAAAEALIIVLLQVIHHLAQHDVLFEYTDRLGAELSESIKMLDLRTAILLRALVKKGFYHWKISNVRKKRNR